MAESATLEPPNKTRRSKSPKAGDDSPETASQPRSSGATGPKGKVTAETLASKQREISVSEFFAKNRHLLGFDNPRKALLTTIKEAVDNSLDACEEAGILPDLLVEIRNVNEAPGKKAAASGAEAQSAPRKAPNAEDRYRVIVQDNGPGIVRKQIENIFGKLLYGSKFHRLKMSRGQQGIGISAAGMYGLITTGKPVLITTKTARNKPAHEVLLKMDTSKNKADVVSETEHPEDDALFPDGHGTRVEIELLGKYFKGARSVDEYIQLTAIANPHATITYKSPPTSAFPDGETITYERTVTELPEQPEEIKPHPHGIELGTLIGMLERTQSTKLGGFFDEEFCRVSPAICKQVCDAAGLTPNTWVKSVEHQQAEQLFKALQEAKVMGPPTNCLSPIGVRTLLMGLERGLKPEFITASSRPAAVYRGRPFVIEAGIAFGGNLAQNSSATDDNGDPSASSGSGAEPARVYRFANRVPLQYQQSACSSFKAVCETNWRNYGCDQPRGSLPSGPLVIMIHMASVWVPFTSESKEAIADYDEIREEMTLALKECGRKLKSYLNRRQAMRRAGERRTIFLRYIGEVSKAAADITGADAKAVYDALMLTAQKKTAQMDQVLDEEGRVIDKKSARDESVYIREQNEPGEDDETAAKTPPATGRSRAEQSSLFGDADDETPIAPAPGTKKKIVKKVLKKVRKKRPSA